MINGLDEFIKEHRLPVSYAVTVEQWFAPVAQDLARRQAALARPLIAGISGAQGSGKSTLADLLAWLCKEEYQLNTIVLSLDDFYHTRQQRQSLATSVHPLMATRGVPGSHDISLALDTIRKLCAGKTPTLVPRFDKANDDRHLQEKWDCVNEKIDLILLEGWCLGAEPQADNMLVEPINELEKSKDANGIWRQYVNQQLHDIYPPLFKLVDTLIMLKAPSFECVHKWRLEQETRLKSSLLLADKNSDHVSTLTMDAIAITHFIQHYQRITQHLLKTLPEKADTLFMLDENRKIISMH